MDTVDKKGIGNIHSGRIDIYVPIMFENQIGFHQLSQKINAYIDISIKDHCEAIRNDLKDLSERLEKCAEDTITGRAINQKTAVNDTRFNRDHSRGNDGTTITLGMSVNGFRIEMIPGEIRSYNERFDALVDERERIREYHGIGYTMAQNRYVLLPLYVELNSGENVWLHSVLTDFSNKMGILKLELPLVNVTAKELQDNDADQYIKSIQNKWGDEYVAAELGIAGIRDFYVTMLSEHCDIQIKVIDGTLRNVILSRFDGMPKQINNIPSPVLEDLYRIIAAPVRILKESSCKQTAKEYMDKYSWGRFNNKHYVSTTGGCLSIADCTYRNGIEALLQREYEEENSYEVSNAVDATITYNLCIDVEFALIILLLNRMNASYHFGRKVDQPGEMQSTQKNYLMNQMYIAELQEESFGTISEMVSVFESIMPFYLKKDLVNTKMEAIDRLVAAQDAQRQSQVESAFEIGGFIMALVFGLPAIFDTLSLIRNFLNFMIDDIPYITLENTSIMLWIGLIIGLIFYMLSKMHTKKKHYFK